MGDPPNPSKSIQSRICQYKPSSGPASMGYPIDGNPHGKIQNELPNRRRISRFCLPCGRPRTLTIPWPGHALRQKVMLVDGPAKSKSPVGKGGFCIPLFICFQHVSTCFNLFLVMAHPQYDVVSGNQNPWKKSKLKLVLCAAHEIPILSMISETVCAELQTT